MIRISSIVTTVVLLGLSACWPETESELSEEMMCKDRLDVVIEHRDGDAFTPGAYTIAFTPSGESAIQVTCTLIDNQLDGCKGNTGDLELMVKDSATRFVARIDFSPSSLTVAVEHEEQLLDRQTISPKYHMETPNGPERDPICFQASVSMELV